MFCILVYIYTLELFDLRVRGTAFGFSVQIGRVLAAGGALMAGQIIAICHGSYAIAGACMAMINLLGIIASLFMINTSGVLEDVQETCF